MKIIIAYASAGAGHRKAAEALFNYYKMNSQKDDIRIMDVLDFTNPLFKTIYVKGYLFLVNNALWLWSMIFNATASRFLRNFNKKLFLCLDLINARKFAKLLIDEQPDILISTHFMPPEIAAYLKNKQRIRSKIVTVVTDFGVHPFWIHEGTDIYAVASPFSRKQLVKEGVDNSIIIESGIPIEERFIRPIDKETIRAKLGLDKNKVTALIMTGSFGIGPIEEIVQTLHNDLQIVVVCANNKELYEKLSKKDYPNVKVFGFVHNIDELMSASDIAIVKPGGLTISELLSMELAPIFICPIPGQETNNIKALEEYGLGTLCKNAQDIKKIVLGYIQNPQTLLNIKTTARSIKKPSASQDIFNALR